MMRYSIPFCSIQPIRNKVKSILKKHPWGVAAVLIAILLSLPGIHWGKYECWNLDQMANVKLRADGLPANYLKPPLLTYLNQVILLPPTKNILKNVFRISGSKQQGFLLMASRLLTLSMFAASVWLLYLATLRASGTAGAAPAVLLYATSSGILVFNRFLTADSPLLFWMIASLFFAFRAAQTRKVSLCILSGILAGLATADKYNGLWAGAALPAALLVAMGFRCFSFSGFWLGGMGVPVGFVIGNPGALLDTRRFWEDFYYNLQTTPVYEGQSGGTGYARFFELFPEILGWPGTVLVAAGIFLALGLLISRKLSLESKVLLAAAFAVFLPYYLSMGKFPRMTTRFVLPAIPFLVVIASVGFARIPWKNVGFAAVLAAALLYNISASIESGLRFLGDPRMDATTWVRNNIPESAKIENSYAPYWRRMPDYRPTIFQMPSVTGRAAMFGNMFAGDKTVESAIARHETPPTAIEMFTKEALTKRNPDFVTFSQQVFEFTGDPRAQEFYRLLDEEKMGYRKVFEKHWRQRAWWSYPIGIDFLVKRMVVLEREPNAKSEGQ